jgi:hypothetical protein
VETKKQEARELHGRIMCTRIKIIAVQVHGGIIVHKSQVQVGQAHIGLMMHIFGLKHIHGHMLREIGVVKI